MTSDDKSATPDETRGASPDEARRPAQYWYNTATGTVEEGHQSSWTHLMGPYPSRAEAEQALERARRRTDEWDRDDEKWRHGGS